MRRNDRDAAPRSSRQEWLYGRRPVLEALRAGRRDFLDIRLCASSHDACADDELDEIRALASQAGLRFRQTDRKGLSELLGNVNHQGVALQVSPYRYTPLEEILDAVDGDESATVLFLDHIEDPQNLGSLLRTADAAGVTGVVIPEDRAAAVTPAAVRASAGAAEHVAVAKVVNLVRAMEVAKERGLWITGLDFGDDAKDYSEIDYTGRCGIVVGNEGRGLARLVREKCDFIAVLPMCGQVSSLNASVAGALVMYEALRQKGGKGAPETE